MIKLTIRDQTGHIWSDFWTNEIRYDADIDDLTSIDEIVERLTKSLKTNGYKVLQASQNALNELTLLVER